MASKKRNAASVRFGHVVESVIKAVSPAWAMRRQAAKKYLELSESSSSRESDHPRRQGSWLASKLSTNSDLEQNLETDRQRSRELYRTFGYYTGAVDHCVDNVVGARGMRPQSRIDDELIRNASEIRSQSEAVFRRWAKTAGGPRVSLAAIQRQVIRGRKRDGEAFVVFSDVGTADRPFPLKLSVIDPDRVATPPKYIGDDNVRLGIRTDRHGQFAGCYIRETSPNDAYGYKGEKYTYYPADRVCHVFEALFPGQLRGLPWCFSVTAEGRDFKDFREAALIKAQTEACMMMLVKTDDVAGAKKLLGEDGRIAMEPGQIMFGSDIDQVFPSPVGSSATSVGDFSKETMLSMASGMNYPFGWIVKDRARQSYSAGGLDEIDGKPAIFADRANMTSTFLEPLWCRAFMEMVLVGAVDVDLLDYGRRPWAYEACEWIGEGRTWRDPNKGVQASQLAVESGFAAKSDVCIDHTGMEYEEILQKRKRERELDKKYDEPEPVSAVSSGDEDNAKKPEEVPV